MSKNFEVIKLGKGMEPHWKKVWITLKEQSPYIEMTDINTILNTTGKRIIDGLTVFKPYTAVSFTNWKSSVTNSVNHRLGAFVQFISENFNIDAHATWNILCNFLMFEYHGNFEDIDEIALYELYCGNLLKAVWNFYSSERMFLIKILRFIMEGGSVSKPRKEFIEFVKKETITEIRKSLYKQLKLLIQERVVGTTEKYKFYTEWSDRNYREQLEIMLAIITTIHYERLDTHDLKNLFDLFLKQNIKDVSLKNKDITLQQPSILTDIKSLQNLIIITGIQEWWTNRYWIKKKKYMESAIIHIRRDSDYSLIDLAWATLLKSWEETDTSLENEKPDEYQLYYQFALQNNVFRIFYNVLVNRVINTSSCKVAIYKACSSFFESVCLCFNVENSIYHEDGSILVLSELLKVREVLEDFFAGNLLSLVELYNTAVRMFPLDFEPLSYLSKAMLTHVDHGKRVIKDLQNLQGFTEKHSSSKTDLQVHCLSDTYRPFNNDSLVIPSGTTVKVWKSLAGSYASYMVEYSYFTILQHLIEVFVHSVESKAQLPPNLFSTVCLGFEVLYEMLKCNFDLTVQTGCINKCLQHIYYIMNNILKPGFDNVEILTLCLEISIALMDHGDEEITQFLFHQSFLPKTTHLRHSIMECIQNNLYQDGKFTKPISMHGLTSKTTKLALLFTQFVIITVKRNSIFEIQVPGCMFVLLVLFPKIIFVTPNVEVDHHEIVTNCLSLLQLILEKDTKEDEHGRFLFNKFFPAFIETDIILRPLVQIFGMGNTVVQQVMEKETNWENGKALIFLDCIKKSFVTTKFLLGLTEKYYGLEDQKIFVSKMLSLKTNLIKVLVSYIHYSFDISVPKIVCRILKIFAQDPKLMLLALLEMDHCQANSIFLGLLRDPLCDEDTKVAVIELVATCVESQDGMTVAFFNVLEEYIKKRRDQVKAKSDKQSVSCGENLANFIIEYLENIKSSLEYLNNPLQAAILNLFYKIWLNEKAYLISDIIKKDNFWHLLTDPLFHTLCFDADMYAKIFAIIVIEIYTWEINESQGISNVRNQILIEIIKKFLSSKNQFLKQWLEYMRNELDEPSDLDNNTTNLCLLRAWKNFIIIVRKKMPDALNQPETLNILKKDCLYGLYYHFSNSNDKRILFDYTKLLLLLISNYSFSTQEDEKEDLRKLAVVLKNFVVSYRSLENEAFKECMLAIVSLVIRQHEQFFTENKEYTALFLELIGKTFIFEYDNLLTEITCSKSNFQETDDQERILKLQSIYQKYTIWVLLISIINRVLQLKTVANHTQFFSNYQILPSLLRCVGILIGDRKSLRVCKITVHCLMNYAQSAVAKHFLFVDLNPFYESIGPPAEYLNVDFTRMIEIPWYLKEFWIIYAKILDLFYILQNQFKFLMLSSSLSFIYLHNETLQIIVALVRLTSEVRALQLVCSCLQFLEKVYSYKLKWWTENSPSFNYILGAVKEALNASVGVILRPNILSFPIEVNGFIKYNSIESLPIDILVEIMNLHVEIIFWSLRCLLRCSPSLLDILQTSRPNTIYFALIEHDYRVPKVNPDDLQSVTYGTLLCTMHFLCKVLTQISQRHSDLISPRKKKTARFKQFTISTSTTPTTVVESNKYPNYPKLSEEEKSTKKDLYFTQSQLTGGYLSPETVHAIQRFATSGVSGMSVPWLAVLNAKLVAFTLEHLTTLLAQQIFLTMQNSPAEHPKVQWIKRELCSELQFFHDFIRKRVVYLYNYSIQGNRIFRSFALKSKEEIEQIFPQVSHDYLKYWGGTKFIGKATEEFKKLVPSIDESDQNNMPFCIEEDYLLLISHWFIHFCFLAH